ncbi:protein COFACTOR ASSEMBLY OF COMPLEX C SUBUNIT B CCB4, chloroplastic [Senna tora]|uniref:Protein COFACTOR ASSEMBLY OF COMPLEX C SUBUNIT B CCB4, chloroplastic n=1 Tax=Senna tora TaxID=362788 RepID=A0A834TZX3_9FABA|nr:protein COFACTOR ASSEMBLY OF COMPLEX C SUBUNIT B CCB4, chloroplastic [Senna tora]
MEAGSLLRYRFRISTPFPKSPPFPSLSPTFSLLFLNLRVSSSSSNSLITNSKPNYRGPKPKRDWVADWVSQNDDAVRTLPIYVGAVSLLAVLLNRALSGIAPVADASSSQSRADLLTLGLAVTNILTGLIWLSIRPKSITMVNPQGIECKRLCTHLPDFAVTELLWVWESLLDVTCCRSLVIVYESSCVLQIGFAAESSNGDGEAIGVDAYKLMQGLLYQGVVKSGAQSYLANLSLYPGKSELPFLPSNTQAVILQPLGDKGIAIVGGDTIRGFTTSDQGVSATQKDQSYDNLFVSQQFWKSATNLQLVISVRSHQEYRIPTADEIRLGRVVHNPFSQRRCLVPHHGAHTQLMLLPAFSPQSPNSSHRRHQLPHRVPYMPTQMAHRHPNSLSLICVVSDTPWQQAPNHFLSNRNCFRCKQKPFFAHLPQSEMAEEVGRIRYLVGSKIQSFHKHNRRVSIQSRFISHLVP